jgi:hypothetical protein
VSLGIASIVLGIIDLDKISKDEIKGSRAMTISGIVLGSLAIILSMFINIVGGIFFMKWLRGNGGHMIQRFRNF